MPGIDESLDHRATPAGSRFSSGSSRAHFFGQGWDALDGLDDCGQAMARFGRAHGADRDREHGEEKLCGLRLGGDAIADLAQGGKFGAAASMDIEQYGLPEPGCGVG